MIPLLIPALLLVVLALLGVGCGAGGEPTTGAPQPGDTPAFGFNESIIPGDAGNALLAESGAEFVRVPLPWLAVEPTEGARNWMMPDRINDELEKYGLRPLWVVTGAPCWAALAPCSEQRLSLAPAEENFDAYAEFAADVAERYPESIGIEVWNEPNIPNFWRPKPDAGAYRELLSMAADAIHETGSEVPVVMAGPSPTTLEQSAAAPDKIPFVEFIEATMSGEDRPDVDAIGTHPYSLLQKDKEPVAETIRLFEEANAAAESAAPGVPVWVTEVGLTTAGSNAVSAETQAEGLKEIVETFAAADVPVIAVHRFFDQPDPEFRFEEGFGVVAADQSTRKPAFCALAEAVDAACE